LVQNKIPSRTYLLDNVPFAILHELAIKVPIDHWGYAGVYINDMMGLMVDLPGMPNAERLEAPNPLAIKVAAWPEDTNKPIPCKLMVAKSKLAAEGGLAKMEVILGWHF
jgi:hypothetical protein